MRPRISEFSYGFALTRELIDKRWRGLQLTKAPYLPSLVAEGQQGGGFDVKLDSINMLVFLQFKVSHRMTRTTAKGVSEGDITVPYYRFDIHAPKLSDQHKLLLALEKTPSQVKRIVRYAAPAFFFEGDFDHAYRTGTISNQTVFVAPSQVRLPDAGSHSVGFNSPQSGPIVLSDPRRIDDPVDYEALERHINEVVREDGAVRVAGPEIEELRDGVLQMASIRRFESRREELFADLPDVSRERVPGWTEAEAEVVSRLDEQAIRTMRPLDAIGHIAWTHLGCATIVLGTETQVTP